MMLKALLHHPLARRMWHLSLRTLAVLMMASECPDEFNTSLFQHIPYHSSSNVLYKRLEDKCKFYLATMVQEKNKYNTTTVQGSIRHYPIWEVIQRENGPVSVSTDTNGLIKVLPPKTTEETLAREKERKSRTTLLMALPEDHLAKFLKMTNAKEMWGAIKFQSLPSQLETHGVGVSTEDANQKFLRSLPSAWSQDLEQLDEFDLEEMDLKWQVAMISMRMKKFYKKTGRKLQFDAKEPEKTMSDDLVTGGTQQSFGDFLMEKVLIGPVTQKMNRRTMLSWLATVQVQTQRCQYRNTAIYSSFKKVEAQLVAHQQGQLWYEEKIRFMKIDLDDKTDVLTYHKKLLAEAEKEKEDLKAKVEKWHNSSKNLNILLNSQMSARDKAGLGYGDQLNKGVLSYENEVFQSVFVSRTSETENSPVNDRYAEGMHSQASESETQTSDFDTCDSNCSDETHESLPEPAVNEPKVVSQPKVWSDAPIIEEYESDSEDEHVSLPTEEQETPSFANKQVKTPRETVKNQFTHSKNPKVDKKDCDFHEKRMAKQVELNKKKGKDNVQRENKPVWNNVQRVNHKNQFVPRAVLTRTGKIPVSTARASGTNNDYPHRTLQNKGIVDSGCSRHMTGNKAYLAEYQDFNGGPVAFGGSKGYITGKGKIKIGKLDFEDVCFVKELQHFNLFSVSQICDKKNKVLFTDSECLVLSPEFKLPDANQVLLRIPRQNNMYSFNLENLVPSGGLACLIAKATIDESNKWHRRLGHVNFKNLNKLVKGNLDSTSVRSLNHKTYCLVITDDFSRFSWVFFLRTKDETSGILKDFIRQIENQLNQKVKSIRCDNGTEFKNMDFIKFCGLKGIKREYSNARTPQQNGVAERKNRMVLVTKPQNKTPYELITGKIPIISYIRPFGCHVTILNTIDHLGKFDGKSDEGFLVGYSLQSKAFRVYNLETKRVEENLYITFLENKPNVAGKGPTWLFDLDYLTDSMNYQPVRSENQANKHAGPKEANHNVGTEDNIDAGDSEIEAESAQDYFVLPIWSSYTSTVKSSKAKNAGEEPNKHPDLKTDEKPVDKEDQVFLDELERLKRQEHDANDAAEALRKEFAQDTEDLLLQAGAAKASSTNIVNTASTPVSTASPYGGLSFTDLTNTDQDDSEIPALEEIYNNPTDGIFTNASYDDEGAVADFTNLETIVNVVLFPIKDKLYISSTQILRSKIISSKQRSKLNQKFLEPKHFEEEGIDNDEGFANVLGIEAIRILIAFASNMVFKSIENGCEKAFLYGKINRRTCDSTFSFCRIQSILRRYLQSSESSLWFTTKLLSQVTPKTSHLNAVKRIFRYLKGKPKLGLWYPRVSSFDLEAYSDSDYAGANLDRKSTTGGCQFLGRRLISWQCKKQTIMATSTTEAEYVAAANCCGQVLWI
ncbi:putative ribonuclease H-like domain-containing protein [Tanacetum coccineum]|uniref:Ribonuclease H-like domain-containing protein n=1 Tax=Tanacetum coccineum TaxID=301880 RepID=A0ABQ4YDI8_9ASTR